MTATPEHGPVMLIYGCTDCHWIYPPETPEETSEKYLLMAQFKFEQHDCSKLCPRIMKGA
jgi:rubredoxin